MMMTSTTHSPGFTHSLLSTLRTTRAQVDAYVETQKEQADLAYLNYEAKLAQEQQEIDAAVEQLVCVQQERGLNNTKHETTNNTTASSSLAARREQLSTQQATLKEEIDKLREKQTQREKHVEGEKGFFVVIEASYMSALMTILFLYF
jgi:beta-glucosidase-like glycosyl hydrolase